MNGRIFSSLRYVQKKNKIPNYSCMFQLWLFGTNFSHCCYILFLPFHLLYIISSLLILMVDALFTWSTMRKETSEKFYFLEKFVWFCHCLEVLNWNFYKSRKQEELKMESAVLIRVRVRRKEGDWSCTPHKNLQNFVLDFYPI